MTLTFQGHCMWPWNGAVEFPIHNLLLLSNSNVCLYAFFIPHHCATIFDPQFQPFSLSDIFTMKVSLSLVRDSAKMNLIGVILFGIFCSQRQTHWARGDSSATVVLLSVTHLARWRHPRAGFNCTHASPVCKGRSAHTTATFRHADRPLWLVTSLR